MPDITEADLWFPPDQCPLTGAPTTVFEGYPDDGFSSAFGERVHMPPAKGYLDPAATPPGIARDLDRGRLFISENAKALRSFNTRIAGYRLPKKHGGLRVEGGTCMPTEWCVDKCYAKTSRFVTWKETNWQTLTDAQRRYMQNRLLTKWYRKAGPEELEREAQRIIKYCRRKKPYYKKIFPVPVNNLRWNGGGDFDSGAVKLVNMITQLSVHDDFASRQPGLLGQLDSGPFRLWAFTRIAKWLKSLQPRPNLFIQVSLDPMTPPLGKMGQHIDRLMQVAPRLGDSFVGFAYATDHPSEEGPDPRLAATRERLHRKDLWIATVFGYHCGALHTEVGDPMECCATNPRISGNCQICRWCMTSNTEKAAEGVRNSIDAFLKHGGTPEGLAYKRGGKVYQHPTMSMSEARSIPEAAEAAGLVPWM